MISKEERAELRMASEFAGTPDRLDPKCALRLLDALDALDEADAEVARLKAEIAELRADASLTARARAIVDNLGWESAPLKARIAELEAAAQWRPNWIPGQYGERGVWIVCRQSEPNNADGLMGPWLVEWKDGEGKWYRTPADYSICALIERRMKEWGVPIPAPTLLAKGAP